MKRLLQWLRGRWRASDAAAGAVAGAAGPPRGPAPAAADHPHERAPPTAVVHVVAPGNGPVPPAPELQFFAWLTDDRPAEGALTTGERTLLTHLDAVTADDGQRAELVPRARSIIPQLMHSLRDENQSVHALSARVARDPNLVVEVLRLAGSAGYRIDTPVADLTQAVGRLGTDGLRRAIARVLLKPIFDAQADPLLGRTAERLWRHSEATADLCLQTASIAHVEPFDAYLAGLMYNVGWTAAFRAMDRSTLGAPPMMSAAFVHALAGLHDRLFAHLVKSWALSATLSALAAEILIVGFENAQLPLGTLLRTADRAAFLQLQRSDATTS